MEDLVDVGAVREPVPELDVGVEVAVKDEYPDLAPDDGPEVPVEDPTPCPKPDPEPGPELGPLPKAPVHEPEEAIPVSLAETR